MSSSSIPCKYCGNPIVFDDNVVSKNGKKIPLQQWNLQPHDCPFSPFIKSRAIAVEKKSINKLKERQIIDNLKEHVTITSNRLQNYELDLVVRKRED